MATSALNAAIRRTSRTLKRWRLSAIRSGPATGTGRPTVVGLFRIASGIGSGGRVIFRALQAMGYNPALIDLSDRLAPGQPAFDWLPPAPPADDDRLGPVIIHLNPPEVPFALSMLGVERLRNRYRVGMWAWELERMPAEWRQDAGFFHEIWAPSEFTADAIRASVPDASVSCVHYPMVAEQVGSVGVEVWRKQLAPRGERIVFCAFDARSSVARKNPCGTIDIFKAAVGERQDVCLALKVSNLEWSGNGQRELMNRIAGDRRIQLLTGTLDNPEMNALIGAADIYLSPHRSEGFGFMLVKSLMSGVDVMMTDWSGNADFADLPGAHPIKCSLVAVTDASGIYGRGGRWAEPDVRTAAERLRGLLDQPRDLGRRALIGAAAADRFSPDAWQARLSPQFKRHTLLGESVNLT